MDTLNAIRGAREEMEQYWPHKKIIRWLLQKLNNNATIYPKETT